MLSADQVKLEISKLGGYYDTWLGRVTFSDQRADVLAKPDVSLPKGFSVAYQSVNKDIGLTVDRPCLGVSPNLMDCTQQQLRDAVAAVAKKMGISPQQMQANQAAYLNDNPEMAAVVQPVSSTRAAVAQPPKAHAHATHGRKPTPSHRTAIDHPIHVSADDKIKLSEYSQHMQAGHVTKAETIAAQKVLKNDGLDLGPSGVDGIAGSKTKTALSKALKMSPSH